MFVIKNTERDYDCYISENNLWKGLLKAKVFNSENEANTYLSENNISNGKIYSWIEIVKIK